MVWSFAYLAVRNLFALVLLLARSDRSHSAPPFGGHTLATRSGSSTRCFRLPPGAPATRADRPWLSALLSAAGDRARRRRAQQRDTESVRPAPRLERGIARERDGDLRGGRCRDPSSARASRAAAQVPRRRSRCLPRSPSASCCRPPRKLLPWPRSSRPPWPRESASDRLARAVRVGDWSTPLTRSRRGCAIQAERAWPRGSSIQPSQPADATVRTAKFQFEK